MLDQPQVEFLYDRFPQLIGNHFGDDFGGQVTCEFLHRDIAGKTEKALACFEQANALFRSLAVADPDSPRAQRDLSISLSDLGDAYHAVRRGPEAQNSRPAARV